jgi:hypothetical protein
VEENNIAEWNSGLMLEITLAEPDDFLKVKETLTRIGIASRRDNKLFQSCHILHKQGRYFIVHFKELFILDGKKSNLETGDVHHCYVTTRLGSGRDSQCRSRKRLCTNAHNKDYWI